MEGGKKLATKGTGIDKICADSHLSMTITTATTKSTKTKTTTMMMKVINDITILGYQAYSTTD